MFKSMLSVFKRYAELYTAVRIPRAAAALSYFLTMTFFPLVICLYTMLGNSYDKAIQILRFAENIMAPETTEFLAGFLRYVAENNSSVMMIAGLTVLLTSSSAASRTLQMTIGEMQGGQRFRGLMYFIFSIVFSLVFLAAIYFAMLVMLTGKEMLAKASNLLPFIDISESWNYLRFIALGGISYVIIWGIYASAKRKSDSYLTYPGAAAATLALVGVSFVFSYFINYSAKYPLVYGSLASVILLMFWIYACSIAILCGALLNICIRDNKEE